MATTIVTKFGGDAPAASDIVRGELAVDTENGRLYTENSSGAVVELGLNPEGNVDVTGTVTADGLVVDGASSGSTVATFTANANVDTPLLVFQRTGGAVAGKIGYDDTNTAINFGTTTNHEIRFLTNNTERMQLDASGNLTGATSFATAAGGTFTTASGNDLNIVYPAGRSLFIKEGSETHVTVDNVGNVGIGVSAPTRRLVLGKGDSTGVQTQYTNSTTGAALGDGFTVGIDGSENAEFWNFENTNMLFATNGTERMRLDSSGNLLVGVTSTTIPGVGNATAGVSIRGTDGSFFSRALGSGDTNNVVSINRSTEDGNILGFQKDGTNIGTIGVSGGNNLFISGQAANHAGLTFATDAILPTRQGSLTDNVTDLGASSERFKNSYFSGDVNATNFTGVGDGDTFIGMSGSNIMRFSTGNAEAARFDSSQNFLVGVSTFANNTLGVAIRGASSGGTDESIRCAVPSTSSTLQIGFYNSNGRVGSISTSGSATAFNTSSDQRLKENIVDAPSASDDIDAIQVRSFDWKSDGSHQKYGMVAQELQVVAPEAVAQGETEDDMMGVDYSKLVPMLVKEVQSLRARVAQLES